MTREDLLSEALKLPLKERAYARLMLVTLVVSAEGTRHWRCDSSSMSVCQAKAV